MLIKKCQSSLLLSILLQNTYLMSVLSKICLPKFCRSCLTGLTSFVNSANYPNSLKTKFMLYIFLDDSTEHLQQFWRDLIYQQVRYKVVILLHRWWRYAKFSSNYKRGNFHLGTIFIYFKLHVDKYVLKFRECEYFQHDALYMYNKLHHLSFLIITM
jgi:hypothetical protein